MIVVFGPVLLGAAIVTAPIWTVATVAFLSRPPGNFCRSFLGGRQSNSKEAECRRSRSESGAGGRGRRANRGMRKEILQIYSGNMVNQPSLSIASILWSMTFRYSLTLA
jgi:hypothetical protein